MSVGIPLTLAALITLTVVCAAVPKSKIIGLLGERMAPEHAGAGSHLAKARN